MAAAARAAKRQGPQPPSGALRVTSMCSTRRRSLSGPPLAPCKKSSRVAIAALGGPVPLLLCCICRCLLTLCRAWLVLGSCRDGCRGRRRRGFGGLVRRGVLVGESREAGPAVMVGASWADSRMCLRWRWDFPAVRPGE